MLTLTGYYQPPGNFEIKTPSQWQNKVLDEWIEIVPGTLVNHAFPNLTVHENATGWQMLDDGQIVAGGEI